MRAAAPDGAAIGAIERAERSLNGSRDPDWNLFTVIVKEITGGDPGVQRGLNKMWADRENWPDGKAKSFRIPPAVTEFIGKAMGR